jgi:hypothetical protein
MRLDLFLCGTATHESAHGSESFADGAYLVGKFVAPVRGTVGLTADDTTTRGYWTKRQIGDEGTIEALCLLYVPTVMIKARLGE